jgi:ArsR family transcriptional regulator
MGQINDVLHVKPRKRRESKPGGDATYFSPPIQPALPAQEAASIATRLRALADPTRVQIVLMLAEHPGEVCVCDITDSFNLDQSTISHHLRQLREAGIIDSVRHGVWAYYFLRSGALTPIIQLLTRLERAEYVEHST